MSWLPEMWLHLAVGAPEPKAGDGTVTDTHGSVFCGSCGTLLSDRHGGVVARIRPCPLGCPS